MSLPYFRSLLSFCSHDSNNYFNLFLSNQVINQRENSQNHGLINTAKLNNQDDLWRSLNFDAKIRDKIAINLIRMFNAGPDVSFKGSPTVSPTTAAL